MQWGPRQYCSNGVQSICCYSWLYLAPPRYGPCASEACHCCCRDRPEVVIHHGGLNGVNPWRWGDMRCLAQMLANLLGLQLIVSWAIWVWGLYSQKMNHCSTGWDWERIDLESNIKKCNYLSWGWVACQLDSLLEKVLWCPNLEQIKCPKDDLLTGWWIDGNNLSLPITV